MASLPWRNSASERLFILSGKTPSLDRYEWFATTAKRTRCFWKTYEIAPNAPTIR
jgi:hypothetical protein